MVGVDVVDVERLRDALNRFPRLEERLFSTDERAYCNRRRDPIIHFAGILAAKEAVIKALRLGPLISWAGRIEILWEPDGAPVGVVNVDGGARRVPVSISRDGPFAIAFALQH